MKGAATIPCAGSPWAIAYGLVLAAAWFAFMRAAWYRALAVSERVMPWTEMWSVWAVLNVPLGMATAAYFRQCERDTPRAGWAWFESLSRTMTAASAARGWAARHPWNAVPRDCDPVPARG